MKAFKCDECGEFYTAEYVKDNENYSIDQINEALIDKYGNAILSLDICCKCCDKITAEYLKQKH